MYFVYSPNLLRDNTQGDFLVTLGVKTSENHRLLETTRFVQKPKEVDIGISLLLQIINANY